MRTYLLAAPADPPIDLSGIRIFLVGILGAALIYVAILMLLAAKKNRARQQAEITVNVLLALGVAALGVGGLAVAFGSDILTWLRGTP